MTEAIAVDRALVERWALRYLERYASSAENLRRVLLRRARRLAPAPEDRSAGSDAAEGAAALIDALVERYRMAGLLDDRAYAAGRARARLRRGASLRSIRAGLAAKGVTGEDAASALAGLAEGGADPDLAAAGAFARRRRLGPFRRGAADRTRELAAFARAGFARRAAEAVLDCADESAVLALAAGEPD